MAILDLSDEELKLLKEFFGTGTFSEDSEVDDVFQSIQQKIGNKPTDMRDGLFEWTVVFRADRVDTTEEMSRILGDAITERCADILEIMEIYPGDVTATDYELDKREDDLFNE